MANELFQKPTINGDYDTWGEKLNSNWDKMEIFNTTIESNLGFEYNGTNKTSGICSLFGGNLEYNIDTNTLSLTGTFDIPTLTSPVINGVLNGTSVSDTPIANKVVRYDVNANITANKHIANTEMITPKIHTNTATPLDLGTSAEVVDFEVTDTATLKDLIVTGSVTGIPTGSSYILAADLSWSVGVGLDYETLQEALQEASKYKTTLKTGLSSVASEQKSYTINITIEDGHEVDYWIFLENKDLSFVNILYAGTGSLAIDTLSGVVSNLGFIYGKNSKLPKFRCDFSISATANTGIPLFYLDNSELFLKNIEIDNSLNVTSGDIKGYNNSVINLDGIIASSNLYFDNCNIFLNSSNFTLSC